MNKKLFGIIIAVVAIGAIAGIVVATQPGKNTATHSSSGNDMEQMQEADNRPSANSNGGMQDLTMQTEVSMDISDFAFENKTIKIKKGTKVTWTNRDSARHNVFSKDAGGPQGELLGKGESFNFTFDTAGTFNYLCEPHPYMKGVVEVI